MPSARCRRGAKKRRGDRGKERDARRRQKECEQLERDIERLEQGMDGFESQFVALDPNDYEQARALKQEYEELQGRLEGMYADWERLADDVGDS